MIFSSGEICSLKRAVEAIEFLSHWIPGDPCLLNRSPRDSFSGYRISIFLMRLTERPPVLSSPVTDIAKPSPGDNDLIAHARIEQLAVFNSMAMSIPARLVVQASRQGRHENSPALQCRV